MASDLSGWRQVSQTDKALAEVLADGSVAAPDLVGFNDWQKWRKSSGTRPVVARGDPKTTTSAQEVLLWKITMEELFGFEWRGDLAEMEAALAASADEEDSAGALPPAGASLPVGASRAAGAGSSAPAGVSTSGAAGSAAGAPAFRTTSGFDTPGGEVSEVAASACVASCRQHRGSGRVSDRSLTLRRRPESLGRLEFWKW